MPNHKHHRKSDTSSTVFRASNSVSLDDSGVFSELGLEIPNYEKFGGSSSTTARCRTHRRSTRFSRKYYHPNPYILRSTKFNNLQKAAMISEPPMEGSGTLFDAACTPREPVKHNTILLEETSSGHPMDAQQTYSSLNPHVSFGFVEPQTGSDHRHHHSQTVIIDGKNYEVTELIAVINRLKQDVRVCTERISWLEAELHQSKLTISARERDIHKLRSVLDQKVPTQPIRGIQISKAIPEDAVQASTQAVGLDEISAQFQPVAEPMRVKKQGVSGESQTQQRTSGLVHHPKDARSSHLIREAIENNEFLRHLDESQVEEIVKCMYKKHIAQGAYVIREGQTGDALYVVAEGVMEVTKNDQILGRMDVGRAFGELALLYNCNRTASVRAVTQASAWTLDRHVFQQIMMSSCLHRHEENFNFLKSVPALKSLPVAKMHKLADVLETVYYGPDEYIIREGEIGETFFIIQSGKVRVTKSVGDSQKSKEIRQLYAGDCFGEKALYNSEKRSANVISMESGVYLLSLDRSNFIHLIGDLNEIKSKNYDKVEDRATHPTQDEEALEYREVPGEPSEEVKLTDLERVAVLGVGGFGCVDLVVWTKDPSRSFALKRMKKHHIVQTRQQEHICSERQIMLQLRCNFICRLYCTYKDSKYVYMLMESCLGGELWTVLRNRGRFNDVVARFVVACVLEAFTYLHTQGIIYRDLKPENLLLDENGYVKLCDFGFAKRIGLGKKTWTFCGTPEYVAPEIILNKGHDYSADYWSLGILIFELLTGSPPFTGSDPMKIYNVVLRGIDAIQFPSQYINRSATTLIKRLCAHNPAQRLGYGLGGIIDIKQNKYFQGFDWIGLLRRTLTPPIRPQVTGPTDVSNFDKYPDKIEHPPDELSGWDADF
ncbi:cGMP-dependent protein kinase, isozyme 1 [Clonorchis sinensis]|uniref:cGMP-dependent protein kinase, isozyme 1 n=2 Tax=Clonorchis sinensis TaxID=79923 RepID=A0A8T1M590_CLOSI|nr:cGMP-dependent protein kinase, isozyme 1 [Clonorchis sinensis]GAA51110.1 cGMP-dependent protein kinase isozyme 1 [Clonorchis sinensis]